MKYAIYRKGSKSPNVIRARSLAEARDFAVPLTMLFFPGQSLQGMRVTRFSGKDVGLKRWFILSLLNVTRQ